MGKSEDQDFQPLTQFLRFKLYHLMTNMNKLNHVVTNITNLLYHLLSNLPKLNHLVTNITKLNHLVTNINKLNHLVTNITKLNLLVTNITITNLAPPRPQVLQPLLPPISRSDILRKTWLALKKCSGLQDHLK